RSARPGRGVLRRLREAPGPGGIGTGGSRSIGAAGVAPLQVRIEGRPRPVISRALRFASTGARIRMGKQDRRAAWGPALCVALLCLLSPAVGHAHALLHEVVEGDAVIVRFT